MLSGPGIIASIFGFAVAAQFVSLVGLEAPYYVVLIGAGALKLASLQPVDPPSVAQFAFASNGDTIRSGYEQAIV